MGHGEDKATDDNRSPVFLQWLDCVWQLICQFPTAFEFNEVLLLTIADYMYSCLFGTFLCNSESQRKKEGIASRTKSIWSMVNSYKEEFLNPFYTSTPNSSMISEAAAQPRDYILIPRCSAPFIHLWTSYYCRWNARIAPQSVEQIRSRNKELLAMRAAIQQKAEELQKQLQNKYSRSQGSSESNTQNASSPTSPNNQQIVNSSSNVRVAVNL